MIHRQMGKQSVSNVPLKEYLRHYVFATQKNQIDLVEIAQLSYNLHKSSIIGLSPFELANKCQGSQQIPPQRLGFLRFFSCLPNLESVRERAQESSLLKPTLWSSKIVVRVIKCKILDVQDLQTLQVYFLPMKLIWGHPDLDMNVSSLVLLI